VNVRKRMVEALVMEWAGLKSRKAQVGVFPMATPPNFDPAIAELQMAIEEAAGTPEQRVAERMQGHIEDAAIQCALRLTTGAKISVEDGTGAEIVLDALAKVSALRIVGKTPRYAVAPELVPIIAAACHERNRIYCLELGDSSQLPWDQAPEWQRVSACKGVLGILCNGNTAEQSHESWCVEKRRTGWVYGPEKKAPVPAIHHSQQGDECRTFVPDEGQAGTHPCLVPYSDLPPEQRRKDALFRGVCLGMARMLNLPTVG